MINHPAQFWEFDKTNKRINCYLCPQLCKIHEGKTGLCKTRKNLNDNLIANNYGKVASIALDPIEKKPLYHFKPGSNILSLGTYGCNMKCSFCQNYAISQYEVNTRYITTDEIISLIKEIDNNAGIAFTYNEPFMWYEFIYDTAKRLKEINNDIKIVIVTNGYINEEPLKKIIPFIDALNIDLKTYNDSTYKKLCKASLNPVLRTIEIASKQCHIEVTTLVIPEENDSLEEIEEIATFISKIDKNIPLHLTRYFPNYKMTKEATPIDKINQAKTVAQKHLNYVYTGNTTNNQNTYCHNCQELLISRNNYKTEVNLKTNTCTKCQEIIPIKL